MRQLRGFAAMDAEKRREIAARGGKNVPAHKRSYSQNKELAVTSGKKGGISTPKEKRSYYRDRNLAIEAGRKGGKASQKKKSEILKNKATI